MPISKLVLSLALVAPLGLDGDGDELPQVDPKVVAAAVADIEKAFESEEAPVRAAAIARHGSVAAPEVVELVAAAVRDADPSVVGAALQALRAQAHPAALEALHATYKRHKKLRKQPELFAQLLEAIGQHASPSSIDVLADDAFELRERDVVTARILGLGHVRHERSVRKLMELVTKADRSRTAPHAADFRLSLAFLTGVDHGDDLDRWVAWWNDAKKSFELPAEPPKLPRAMQLRYESYWGYDIVYERKTKREDRGKDPEKGDPEQDERASG